MIDQKNLTGPDNKPSSSKHHMKDINSRTANYKRMMKLLDQRKKELPLLQFRKRIIEKQNQMNYQNEYDRLRNLLHSNARLPADTIQYLDERKQFLRRLGAKKADFLENNITIII